MTEQKQTEAERIREALAAPFDPSEVEWKPQSVSKDGNRALACAYIDARCVMERLDDVLGVDGWEDAFDFHPDGNAVCTLRVCIEGRWITKTDVGGESDQSDKGDRRKAAVSDALKRAAVKVGVGRYLYSLPAVWADYDSKKKCFARTPTLPPWALPKGKKKALPAPAPAPEEPEAQPTPVAVQIPARPDDSQFPPDAKITPAMSAYLQAMARVGGTSAMSFLHKYGIKRAGEMTIKQYRAALLELAGEPVAEAV